MTTQVATRRIDVDTHFYPPVDYKALREYLPRGLGLKSDTPEVRALRLHHHNQFWGPAGRNLPEDIMAVETQWECMQSGAMRYSIFAREEELRAQDDGNVRHFYQEWGRRMGRDPARPFDAA